MPGIKLKLAVFKANAPHAVLYLWLLLLLHFRVKFCSNGGISSVSPEDTFRKSFLKWHLHEAGGGVMGV